jgi:hypothetical protein
MAHQKSSRRDVVTLADLAPRQDVKGGSQRRVFGADPIGPMPGVGRTSDKKVKDLPAKSSGSVKGGGLNHNDNITLVRGAKPTKKKDLPPRKDVKGGSKRQ